MEARTSCRGKYTIAIRVTFLGSYEWNNKLWKTICNESLLPKVSFEMFVKT